MAVGMASLFLGVPDSVRLVFMEEVLAWLLAR
jgi:hypothetical protein